MALKAYGFQKKWIRTRSVIRLQFSGASGKKTKTATKTTKTVAEEAEKDNGRWSETKTRIRQNDNILYVETYKRTHARTKSAANRWFTGVRYIHRYSRVYRKETTYTAAAATRPGDCVGSKWRSGSLRVFVCCRIDLPSKFPAFKMTWAVVGPIQWGRGGAWHYSGVACSDNSCILSVTTTFVELIGITGETTQLSSFKKSFQRLLRMCGQSRARVPESDTSRFRHEKELWWPSNSLKQRYNRAENDEWMTILGWSIRRGRG